jgi:hypothetical protein
VFIILLWLLYYIVYNYDELTLNVGLPYSSTLKMEGICFFETSVKFRRTTRRYIPEYKIFEYKILLPLPVTVAQRSKACTAIARSEAGIVGSNHNQGMDVWYVFIRCFCCPVFK